MDYKELIEELRKPMLVDGSYLVDHFKRDAATTITDLLARAEAAEKERDSLREVLDIYCGEDAITAMLKQIEGAEARVLDL